MAMRSPFLIPHSCSLRASVTTLSRSCFELISVQWPFTRCFATQAASRPTAARMMSVSVKGPMLCLQPRDDHIRHGARGAVQGIVMVAEYPRSHHLIQSAKKTVRHYFV